MQNRQGHLAGNRIGYASGQNTLYTSSSVMILFYPSTANGMFVCTPGTNVNLDQLCDGNNDCPGGDDETVLLCESKLKFSIHMAAKCRHNISLSPFGLKYR